MLVGNMGHVFLLWSCLVNVCFNLRLVCGVDLANGSEKEFGNINKENNLLETILLEEELFKDFGSNNYHSHSDYLSEGTKCLTTLGQTGVCTELNRCPQQQITASDTKFPSESISKISELESSIHSQACTFTYKQAYKKRGICCVLDVQSKAENLNLGIGVTPIASPPVEATPSTELNKTYTTNYLTYNGYASESSLLHSAYGNRIQGVYQWPPILPTHPSIPGSWPPPIPTHPPGHNYPTHPPTFGLETSTVTMSTKPRKSTTSKPTMHPASPARPSYSTFPTKRPTMMATLVTPSRPVYTESSSVSPTHGLPLQCGIKNPISKDQERIVGGSNASPHEFPWMAVLFKSGKQFCGGSLITKNHILTAAHCVARMNSWDVAAVTVHLGDYNIRTDFEVKHISRRIRRLVRHKGFDFSHLHNDIAILTLSEPVQFSFEVQPICLPTSHSHQGRTYSGHIAIIAGWGSLRENGPQPSILQKAQIPIWSNYECARKYGKAAPGGIIESMVCAGQAAMDSCSGDSGGPMIVKEGNRYTQIGVVSWGIGCGKGQYPGVYTRVTSLLPWIYKNIK